MSSRLSRLEMELDEKNKEIRRLHAELVIESDESSALRQKVEELQRQIRHMEKNHSELRQTLEESHLPDNSFCSCAHEDLEAAKLKSQMKKLKDELETVSQKTFHLNSENETLRNQMGKDRKKVLFPVESQTRIFHIDPSN